MAQVVRPIVVREVWHYNIDQEFHLIQQAISCGYTFASFDTEFPGTVVPMPSDIPKCSYSSLPPSRIYSIMKKNVDLLHPIQFGLTLSDANGNLPNFSTAFCYLWQFTFRDFDPRIHLYNPDSIELLRNQGIEFTKNMVLGIDSRVFGAKLRMLLGSIKHGIMGVGHVTWVTFHGTYDFGILIKILIGNKALPDDLETFMKLVQISFGDEVYDLKVVARCVGHQGSLVRVAKDCGVERNTGVSHQAGSDSLLILQTFAAVGRKCAAALLHKDQFSLKVQGLST